MTVNVHYRVPLVVEVELSTQEVLAVHVVDEAIEGPIAVQDENGGAAPTRDREQAISIARRAFWPGWTFGF